MKPMNDTQKQSSLPATMPGRNGGTLKRGGSSGRPKGSLNISTILRRVLKQKGADGVINAERVALALVDQAAAGNVAAMRELLNRIDGPVPTKIDVRELSDEQLRFITEQYGFIGSPSEMVIRVVYGDDPIS
jgi:hypothetical protein